MIAKIAKIKIWGQIFKNHLKEEYFGDLAIDCGDLAIARISNLYTGDDPQDRRLHRTPHNHADFKMCTLTATPLGYYVTGNVSMRNNYPNKWPFITCFDLRLYKDEELSFIISLDTSSWLLSNFAITNRCTTLHKR